MNKIAVIDLGTNSIKLTAVKINNNNSFSIIFDAYKITRLGIGLQKSGLLSSDAINKTINAIAEFLKLLKHKNIFNIYAIATMALRNAKNNAELLDLIEKKFQINVSIISGDDEARLSFIAATYILSNFNESIVVFDSGGGSTEFIFGNNNRYIESRSLNIGALHITESYYKSNPVSKKEFEDSIKFIKSKLRTISNYDAKKIVGIGGTPLTIASVKEKLAIFNPLSVRGLEIDISEIKRQIDIYRFKTIIQRKEISGLEADRADIILAGAAIIFCILKFFNNSKFTICDYGIRHGFIIDNFL